MSVIRLGSTSKYADGWEQIFGGGGKGRRGGKAVTKRSTSKASKASKAKKSRGKPAVGKAAGRKTRSRA